MKTLKTNDHVEPREWLAMSVQPTPRRYRNMAPKPRGWSHTVATQAVSIMPDGTRKVFNPPSKRATASKVRKVEVKRDYSQTYYDRVSRFGATGNVE